MVCNAFILLRSCFRVAELAKGFNGQLANQEAPFMILEGAMIVLATALLTVFHPGRSFGERWRDAGWTWKGEKDMGITYEN
jgi:RTA1 like protein